MSEPNKQPDLARGARRAEEIFNEETDRLVELSDEDFARAMDAMRAPAALPSADELAEQATKKTAEPQPPAEVVPPPPRTGRGARMILGLIAAAISIGMIAMILQRHELTTWIRGGPASIEPGHLVVPKALTAADRAENLRAAAERACADQRWGLCSEDLDEAEKVDPAGESTARVQALRASIVENTTFYRNLESTGKPGK